MREEFGRLLRATRQEADLSMGDLARSLGVSVPYISDVERGNRAPLTKENILKVAAVMGVDPAPLLAAAALAKGAFELEAENISEAGREAGAFLAREWRSLTDDDYRALQDLLRRRRGERL